MCKAFRYALALFKLVINARKCQSDIITLRSDLEDKVLLPLTPSLFLSNICQVHQLGDC